MPQMAPMNWLFLYCMLIMIFLLFNFLNYYIYLIMNPKTLDTSNNFIKKNLNWM